MIKDYYKILEVDEKSSSEDITKSYRKLAMKWHPDRNKNSREAEEKFKDIQVAYDVLGDQYKRKEYDFTRNLNSNGNGFAGNMHGGQDFRDFSDMFREAFSEMFTQTFVQQLKLQISFWEAIKGVKKTFQIAVRGDKKTKYLDITIEIPPGTNQGESFLIDIEGQKVNLIIIVEQDSRYRRNNLDIELDVDIPLTTALLGGKVIFPHWEGDIEVIIPECTINKQVIVVPNKGVKKNIFRGDLHLIVNVAMPKKLTEEQRKIIKDLHETEKDKSWLQNLWNKFKS